MSDESTTAAPAYPGIAAAIHKALPKVAFTASETLTDVDLSVAPEQLLELVKGLKDHPDLAFDQLANVAGVDFEAEGMAVKYHFYSFRHNHRVQVTVPTSAGHPKVPSLTGLYEAAHWHEREAAEMFGFVFEGHPNLKNLLLDEDLHIHPLLKAHPLAKAEILQGREKGSAGFDF